MTMSPADLGLYAFAVVILFLTPGPVWVALLARAMSGGFNGAWPLALGVTVGDMLWPFLAILGVSWLVNEIEGLLLILKWVAAVMFLVMGVLLIRNADAKLGSDSRLTRPGMWSGFVAGLLVILGNPKAILFYMGLLPGFFDLTAVTWPDIAAILLVSMLVPLAGNLALGAFVSKVRGLLSSPTALRRLNIASGGLLIFVGIIIPLT
ncbi:LysE family translocator [Shimia ponticola]|uniref:LysE family translocator n=1 Tax=Shimia ponticola TaxID=2582893 RepID=UPI0011BE0560|nr:LysE family translocator [Shimia ponticola]